MQGHFTGRSKEEGQRAASLCRVFKLINSPSRVWYEKNLEWMHF